MTEGRGAPEVYVDVVGPHPPRVPVVEVGSRRFVLVYDPEVKKDIPFSFGLFVNDGALSARTRRYPRERRIWMAVESPIRSIFGQARKVAKRFDLVLTHWRPLLELGQPFSFLPYGTAWLGDVRGDEQYEKNKLVSFIGNIEHESGAGYGFRKEAAAAMMADQRVECFGRGIREIPGKLPALRPFAFSVAMENTREDFYFTEKLIDCFLTVTVPIYWGCPSIGEHFDSRGMLVFQDLEELRASLDLLNWDLYWSMKPHVEANRASAVVRDWHSQAGLYRRAVSHVAAEGFDLDTHPRLRPAVVDWASRGLAQFRGS